MLSLFLDSYFVFFGGEKISSISLDFNSAYETRDLIFYTFFTASFLKNFYKFCCVVVDFIKEYFLLTVDDEVDGLFETIKLPPPVAVGEVAVYGLLIIVSVLLVSFIYFYANIELLRILL